MNLQVILSFIVVTALIAVITYVKTKNEKLDTASGYFLGGRSLTGGIIAGSLLMTNLNANNFVGMSSQAYSGNMSVIGWEVSSSVAIVLVAIFLLPRYLKMGLTTLPTFVEQRFDKSTKTFVTWLFLLCYVLNLVPTGLYTGALAISTMFDIPGLLGISTYASVWIVVWVIGIIAAIYAIFGGLKAVALSDTLNGFLLILGGLLIPIFALIVLGNGSFADGLNTFATAHPDKLNAIGAKGDPLPFSTLFTGLFLMNMYYWGTNQSIIQRGFGAKNLKEGQKGFILAALLKIITPVLIIVPGVIAFCLYGDSIEVADTVYPILVREVLPKPLLGLFAAAMFGAILSTVNSLWNSASTLFVLDIYKPRHPDTEEKALIRVSKIFGTCIAVVSMFIAPFIMNASGGVFQYLQTINGFFYVPIFIIVFIGFTTKYVPALAAKVAIVFFVVVYGILQFVIKPDLIYLHQYGILFVISCVLMLVIGKWKPRKTPYEMKVTNEIDVEPWEHRFKAAGLVMGVMVDSYILCSPLGLARIGGCTPTTWILMLLVLAAGFAIGCKLDKRSVRKN